MTIFDSKIVSSPILLDVQFSTHELIALWVVYTVVVIAAIYFILYKRYNFRITKLEEEKKGQDRLINERNVLRALIDNIPDFIYVKDKFSRFVIANNKISDVLNVNSPKDLIGKTDHDYYPKELADMFYSDEQEIIKTGNSIINKDEIGMDEEQNSRYISTTKVPYRNEKGEIVGIIGIGRDITKQKLSETKLKEQAENLQEINILLEERQERIQQQGRLLSSHKEKLEVEHRQLRTLIDSVPDFIYFKDREAKFITANKKVLNVFKVNSVDMILGKTDFDFYPKDLAGNYYKDDLSIMESGDPLINKEEIVYNEFGEKLFLSTTKIPLKNEQGEIFGMVGIGRDITKQKQTEDQLKKQSEELQELNVILEERQEEIMQQSEELKNQRDILEERHNELRTLIDSIPDYIYFKDKDARFITANDHMVKVMKTGILQKLIGKTDFDFYPPELAQKYYDDDMKVLKNGETILNKEEQVLNEMGQTIYISTTKIPLRRESGEILGMVGIGRDITEIKKISLNLQKHADELQELNVLLEERQEEIIQQSEELISQKERIMAEHNQLRTLIDYIPDLIYFKDASANFITANRVLARIMKAGSVENLIGKTDFDFYPKEMANDFYQDDMEVIKSGQPIVNREQSGWDEKGENIILSTTKVPLRDENEKIIGLVGIGRNITDIKDYEKKLIDQAEHLKEVNVLLEERQEEIYQQSEELSSQAEHLKEVNMKLEKLSIVASLADNAVMIVLSDGTVEFVNDGFCKLYKIKSENIEGKNCFVEAKGIFGDRVEEKLKICIEKQRSLTFESITKNRRGEDLYLQTTLTPVIEGEIMKKVIVVESDIKEIKRAEAEIEKHRDELKVLNSTKDKFFSIIAHDLKNPFHAIIGFTDFLNQNYARVKEEEKKRILELINGTSRSTFNLLENLLNWARTQTNAIRFNPRVFNLYEVAKENTKLLQISANKKNIDIIDRTPEMEMVFADINMINTVIRNILTNAIKFTDKNGKVIIESVVHKKYVVLSIADTGIGIDNESLENLFNLDDYRTSVGTSGETGTGLGLIICQEFIKKNNGEIYAKSKIGKGTTFYISVPKPE